MKKNIGTKTKFNAYGLIIFILLITYTVVLFTLLVWGFIKSLHEFDDFILGGASASAWPGKFTIQNYVEAFQRISVKLPLHQGGRTIYLAEMIFNSLLYSVGGSAVHTLTTCIVAYLTVKHKFWFNKVINAIFYFALLVPIVGATPATLKVTMDLNLMDTWLGAMLMKMNFVGGIGFLLFQAAFKSLDDGYKDAALIDGASHMTIMFSISFPLIKTTISTLFMMSFISLWNDYQTPMLYLPTHITAAYGLYKFNGGSNPQYAYITYKVAGFMILLIPIIVIFLIFKDKLMGNLTEGGLKG